MNLSDLRKRKGAMVPAARSLLDFMGKQELAANLFRLTETEAKIQNETIRGQKSCEVAAHTVGRMVRETMFRISGTRPENLPLEGDIKEAKKKLKNASKGFKSLDGKKARALPPKKS